tara:strand:+ start:159 stop:740 length:582 start_codon:yes stop_codon:yes gene_type:complete
MLNNFASGGGLLVGNHPVWGTCPKTAELRYENGQFFQGEKEITYNQFYEIIKLTDYKVWFTDGETLKREPTKGLLQATALTLAGSVGGFFAGVNYDINNASAGEYRLGFLGGAAIGYLVGTSTGIVALIYDYKRVRSEKMITSDYARMEKGEYLKWEVRDFKEIIRLYNRSLKPKGPIHRLNLKLFPWKKGYV